ncbi:MAG: ribulokinase [Clostridia bacterium]|nr:ribulokinase [Clostridia bacterium]
MSKFALGVDFGTLSARALVVETGTGRELGEAVMDYPHGVMDKALPNGAPLPPDWALQHPADYLECLRRIVPEALAKAGADPADVVGVGVDATACTLIPVNRAGTPLCMLPEWEGEKHAYAKLWKHHAGQAQADRMTQVAKERGEAFLPLYGGKISSEWLFPKLWQTLEEAPAVYEAADRFIDASDWIVFQLTGREVRSSCMAGYKALWSKRDGYPSEDYFRALDPRLEHVVRDKLPGPVWPVCARVGGISEAGAALTGLLPGTTVAVGSTDAHVAPPAAGITEPGRLLMILGTSTVHLVMDGEARFVPGICGVVEDGITPGLFGYEAGQTCVGDHFDWFVKTLAPESYAREAAARGLNLHALLTEKAARLAPGESGLLALDWWNGNRSVLVDADLTGLMLGMTLATRPEEIYRALIEATAFGTRLILENFESHGLAIRDVVACGGIARKNAFLMQLYADVTGREIRVARSAQTPALGAAMMGAVAAGKAGGGFDTIGQAAARMGGVQGAPYRPDPAARAVYDRLYAEYKRLHDWFGRGGDDVMKRLKAVKLDARR